MSNEANEANEANNGTSEPTVESGEEVWPLDPQKVAALTDSVPKLKAIRDRLWRAVVSDHVAEHLRTLGRDPESQLEAAGIVPVVMMEALTRSIVMDVSAATEPRGPDRVTLAKIVKAAQGALNDADDRSDLPIYAYTWRLQAFMPGWGTWAWAPPDRSLSSKLAHLANVLERARLMLRHYRDAAIAHHLDVPDDRVALTYNELRLALVVTSRVADSLHMLLEGAHSSMTRWQEVRPMEASFRSAWDHRTGRGPALCTPRLDEITPQALGVELASEAPDLHGSNP